MRHLWTLIALTLALTSPATASPVRSVIWPDLADDAGVQGGGEHDAALIVGVTDYVYLPRIDGAAQNAEAWQQWLLRSRKVPSSKVVLLSDKAATRPKIEKALQNLSSEVGPTGTLWFVFIGHGAPSRSGDDGMLLGADTDADADSIDDRGVPQRRVLSLVGQGKQAHSVVVFDACFSGRTGDGSAALVAGLQATLPNRKATTVAPQATVLAASDSFAGPLPNAGRPAFSYLLLGALRGWGDQNGDKAVDVDEAYAFSRDYIQALFKGSDRLPSKRGPNVVLAKNVREKQPDMAALVSGKCPSGWTWGGRECKQQATVECPAGTTWNGRACVSLCPAGTSWNGRACAATTIECPEGTGWNGRACTAIGSDESAPRWPDENATTERDPYGFARGEPVADRSRDLDDGVHHDSTASPLAAEKGSPLLRYGIYWTLIASGAGLAVTGIVLDTVPSTARNQQFDVADLAGAGLYVAAAVAVGIAAVAPLPGAPDGAPPLGLEPLGILQSARKN